MGFEHYMFNRTGFRTWFINEDQNLHLDIEFTITVEEGAHFDAVGSARINHRAKITIIYKLVIKVQWSINMLIQLSDVRNSLKPQLVTGRRIYWSSKVLIPG